MDSVGVLAANRLSVGYGARLVAGGIDLAVAPGEVLCLLGPNGAGKTTLFRTLLGLIPALAGTVTISGRQLSSFSRRQLATQIAFVPQAHHSDFAYTVLDLVLMGRTAHLGPFDSPTEADQQKARNALLRLGIEPLAEADATRISGGQRQLALIARALAQDARVVVMDEPTASLDLGNRLRVLEIIRAIAADGLAVILSTHDPDQAFAVATNAAILADGRLAAYGPPAEVITSGILSHAYGTSIMIETTSSGRIVVGPPPATAAPVPG